MRSITLMVTVLALVLCAGASFAQLMDWSQWNYHVDVNVNTGPYPRTVSPVELQINFNNYLPAGAAFDENSVRVAEYNDAGRTSPKPTTVSGGYPGEIPSQFDKGTDYDAATKATGEVIWLLKGETGANTTRYYRIYFDTTANSKMSTFYSTDLSLNTDSTSAYTVENDTYRVGYGLAKGNIQSLAYKVLMGSTIMWDSVGGDTDGIWGLYYGTEESGYGWLCQHNGSESATVTYSASVVRLTITCVRNPRTSLQKYTVVRKFYAGGIPYFKNEVKIERLPTDTGTGACLQKQIRWSDAKTDLSLRTLAASDTTTNPITGNNMPYDYIYDYGSGGGIGILMANDFRPDVYDSGGTATPTVPTCTVTNTGNRYWRFNNPAYPQTITHALLVHNGTTQAEAKSQVDAALNDYDCPVQAVLANKGFILGRVTDASDSIKPVKDAMIRVWVNGAYLTKTYTTVLGYFEVPNISGTAKISVKCDGYETAVVDNLNITNGVVTTANISLTPLDKWMNLKTNAWKLAPDSVVYPYVAAGTDVAAFGAATIAPTLESQFVDITVPSDWDSVQGTESNQIYGWYRTNITLPSTWANRDLIIRDYQVDDVAAVYMNGKYVGKVGTFPNAYYPRTTSSPYSTAAGLPADLIIPASAVNTGATPNVLAVRLFDDTGPGGIGAGGPILEVAPITAVVNVDVTGPNDSTGEKHPVVGASVQVVGTSISGVTDANGRCALHGIPGDIYDITVNADGYGTQTITGVDVPDAGTLTIPVTYDSFTATITGMVTKEGNPVANIRVIAEGASTVSAKSGSDGRYTISGLTPGDYQLTFNGIRAVPQTGIAVDAKVLQVIKNVDLLYGYTPVYDDFSGTELNSNKWELFNSDGGDATGTLATPIGGILNIEPNGKRAGIISKEAFPRIAEYEYQLPRKFTGTNQCFCIIKDNASGYANYVDLQDEGSTAYAPYMNCFIDGSKFWQSYVLTSYPYPTTVTVLRTGNYYDIYLNGDLLRETITDKIPDAAYIYMYGFEASGTTTVAYFDNIRAGAAVPVAKSTIADSKSVAPGTLLHLPEAVVIASFGDAFWVENTDRSAGMKVISSTKPTVGKKVIIAGKVQLINNEAVITEPETLITGNGTVPPAIAITGKVAGEFNKGGASAQGMLVKVSGTVTEVTKDTNNYLTGYYLDDGSGLTDGQGHKGLYVIVDPSWKISADSTVSVGQFKTKTGPLTVYAGGSTPIPAVRSIDPDTVSLATFTAYNDFAWGSAQPSTNITTYTNGGYPVSGYLRDYVTGAYVPEKVTISSSSGVLTANYDGGTVPTAGDVLTYFQTNGQWIASIQYTRYVSGQSGWYFDLVFSGLDPNALYEFVGTCNYGGSGFTSYKTLYTISGTSNPVSSTYVAGSTVNGSSSGTTIATDGTSTSFCTGYNMSGYVARWYNIKPAADGTFKIRATTGNSSTNGFPYGVCRLQKQGAELTQ